VGSQGSGGKPGFWWEARVQVGSQGSGGKPGFWWEARVLVGSQGSGGKPGFWWEARVLVLTCFVLLVQLSARQLCYTLGAPSENSFQLSRLLPVDIQSPCCCVIIL
jgi:hypothetical protein